MRLSGVGIEQIVQLADAMIAAERCVTSTQRPAPPRCFALVGTLGAGKTRFCQEIARACGIDPAEVTSPTFTLLKSYDCADHADSSAAPQRLHHLDWYRITDEDELWQLGLDELWETPGDWTLIEWADRFPESMPLDTIWIRIRATDTTDHAPANHSDTGSDLSFREIEFQTDDPDHRHWLTEVKNHLVTAGFTGTIEPLLNDGSAEIAGDG
ncbi:tRNA (adenosine(37)-N6)-threonylcarbamoyltransferase complex ATPase subunit type 1 TsaE [Aporhodopirellula aestuarii]|uniref:tRNA threonylcarbamoyladenosine biosynthesis protein TsaE n=1 Tax=Aporhodopirellula aestuarii TaxID=2950107 RepID=A0ABT0UFU7_9BACT|nr:tRNA (adenosine(37)-N6)-threonylcarbamoyltransferase complex ATPase subunit type 1 TsaE [Aporhodopirellula aestuarii]MCM2375160.1 tRNA (adenosine(37)-N6)-threonylcarbamoyltransferase complex ATPase subunit type 1 TsaE [Aporhodopirellula aestuarii]